VDPAASEKEDEDRTPIEILVIGEEPEPSRPVSPYVVMKDSEGHDVSESEPEFLLSRQIETAFTPPHRFTLPDTLSALLRQFPRIVFKLDICENGPFRNSKMRQFSLTLSLVNCAH
jgi:hypothetical protein